MRGNALSSYYEKFLVTGEVKCIDEEIPFDLPFGWEWCRLRNLCTIYGRIGYRGYTKADMVEKGCGAISISPSNMKENGLMNFDIATYISWFKYEESPEIQIEIGDILVVKTGSSFGKTCIVKDLPEKATINPQIAVLKFVLTHKNWLVFALNAPFVQNQFSEYVIGTSIPTFSQEKLSSTLLPLPPFKEQQRIVDKIVGIIPIVEKYNNAQNELDKLNASNREQLKKSILQEAIQGKLVPQIAEEGTAQELLEQIRLEKQKLVKEGKLKKSALTDSVIFKGDDNKYYEQSNAQVAQIECDYDFPDNWAIARLSTICTLVDGEKKDGQQICLDAKYLRGKSTGDYLQKGKLVQKGDNIILVDGENSGEVFTVPCDGYMGSTFKQLWISSVMYLPYVLNFILFYKELLRKSKRGAAIPHLNKEIFYSLIIGIPPYQEQVRIVNKINEIYSKIRN